jgi:two-component system KDP operon response regulator KdpE
MKTGRILLVEDDPGIRKFLRVALEAQGFSLEEEASGKAGIARAATLQPDLVVLDLGLPDMDGKAVIARIREWSDVPILILSVRQAEEEKVAALDAGANDYVVKPFGIAELLARVRALLRSKTGGAAVEAEIVRGDLRIDLARHEVSLAGASSSLPARNSTFWPCLRAMPAASSPIDSCWRMSGGRPTSTTFSICGSSSAGCGQKLADDPAAPRFILNEPGVGYRFLD